MQKKNLIWIIGGAAVVGYLIYMKKKKSTQQEIPMNVPMLPVTPDQELAPAFVNDTTETIQDKAQGLFSKLRSRRAQKARGEDSMLVKSRGIDMPKSLTQSLLTKKQARQTARSTKKEVRAAGGSRKEARQAARSIRKNRSVGELSVTF